MSLYMTNQLTAQSDQSLYCALHGKQRTKAFSMCPTESFLNVPNRKLSQCAQQKAFSMCQTESFLNVPNRKSSQCAQQKAFSMCPTESLLDVPNRKLSQYVQQKAFSMCPTETFIRLGWRLGCLESLHWFTCIGLVIKTISICYFFYNKTCAISFIWQTRNRPLSKIAEINTGNLQFLFI